MRLRSILSVLASTALLASTLAVPVGAQGDEAATVTPGGTLPGDPSIDLVKVAGGLADPINIANAGDGSGRLFVVERVGLVRIVDKDGTLLDEPFLDISGSVKTDFLEQGLLGLAFDPDYKDNGLFYVYYANYDTNGTLRLVQYHVSADDPNAADPDSGVLVMQIADDPYVNHNGGTVRFGPDGYLYWTTGDGGLAGDGCDTAKNIRTHFAKIFSSEVHTPESELP
jgi:glucose/arabinose dehydrogenase